MNSIIENKQLVHIGAEIVIIAGLSYYFNNKNAKLLETIEVISLRLNQQEEMIQKQEMMIKKLQIKLEENNHEKHPVLETKKVIKKVADKRTVSFEEKPVSIVRIEEEIVEDDTASSDLDKEIEEELKELDD